jgi:drug/metabolite transporter (DMT)-like permease
MLPSRTATALGTGAIVLWASLASLTTLRGSLPPLQTTAITFLIGGSATGAIAVLRGRGKLLRPTLVSFGLVLAGLFGYHVLYFSALSLAPPAEGSLIASLWALFTVLFSGLLPGHRLRPPHVAGALLGLLAATLLVWDHLGTQHSANGLLGFALAFACALVWSSYSVLSRLLSSVPSESIAVSCLATALLAFAASLIFEPWAAPASVTSWLALVGLGLGPVGAAFMLWDIGMKHGNIAVLGVLSYASPILSTALLVALGLAQPTIALGAACILMVAAAVIATRF